MKNVILWVQKVLANDQYALLVKYNVRVEYVKIKLTILVPVVLGKYIVLAIKLVTETPLKFIK